MSMQAWWHNLRRGHQSALIVVKAGTRKVLWCPDCRDEALAKMQWENENTPLSVPMLERRRAAGLPVEQCSDGQWYVPKGFGHPG